MTSVNVIIGIALTSVFLAGGFVGYKLGVWRGKRIERKQTKVQQNEPT